jgi:hypothetical protein
MEKYQLTEEEFLKLYDDSISHKEHKDIISKISDRINFMLREVMATYVSWWDFSNGNEDIDGYFEPEIYGPADNIELSGTFDIPKPYNYTDFPIRWLWEDFEEEFKSDVENCKKQEEFEKQRRKERKKNEKIEKAKRI